MSAARDRFAEELATYEARKHDWLAAGGERKWVVVRGSAFLGPFDGPDEAWRAGIDRLGGPGFMLKRIVRDDRPVVVSPFCLHPDSPQA